MHKRASRGLTDDVPIFPYPLLRRRSSSSVTTSMRHMCASPSLVICTKLLQRNHPETDTAVRSMSGTSRCAASITTVISPSNYASRIVSDCRPNYVNKNMQQKSSRHSSHHECIRRSPARKLHCTSPSHVPRYCQRMCCGHCSAVQV